MYLHQQGTFIGHSTGEKRKGVSKAVLEPSSLIQCNVSDSVDYT